MASLFPLALLLTLVGYSYQHLLGNIKKGEELFLYRQNIYASSQILQNLCPELKKQHHGIFDDSVVPFHSDFAKLVQGKMLKTLTECLTNQTASHTISDHSLTTEEVAAEPLTSSHLVDNQPTTSQPTTTYMQLPADCQELYERGNRCPGVYIINPPYSEDDPFPVWCDFIDGQGWSVIQKRFNGSIDFNKNWTDYQKGFGDIDGEYWLSLDNIHALTRSNNKLYIVLKAANGTTEVGLWSSFYINGSADGYKLMISDDGYRGSLDSSAFQFHHGMMFSTADRDSDEYSGSCAQTWKGGWWFGRCHYSFLNGVYGTSGWGGIMWGNSANHYTESVMRVSRS